MRAGRDGRVLDDRSRRAERAARQDGIAAEPTTIRISIAAAAATMTAGAEKPGFGSMTRANPNGVAYDKTIAVPTAISAEKTATTKARTNPSAARPFRVIPSARS